jgi:hypothetical protein
VTTSETVDWLVREISDLLDAGGVGLYEFVDELNDPARPMSPEQRQAIAEQALERLLGQGNVEIQRRRWGSFDNLGTVSRVDLPADLWHPPDDNGDYLAIVRS